MNQGWYAPVSSGEAVFIGEPAQEGITMVVRKGPIAAHPLLLRITTDAKKAVLQSDDQSITLSIEPDLPNNITLDGHKLRPRILAGGQEIPSLRGPWIKMFVLSDHTTLNLTFPAATYANVEFIDHGPWPVEASETTSSASPWLQQEPTAWASHPDTHAPKPVVTIDRSTSFPKPHTTTPSQSTLGTRDMQPTYQDPASDPTRWSLSLNGGFNATNAYFYRGIGQENQDLILQSHLEGVMRVWRSVNTSDSVKYLDLFMGLTNSHHWGPTGRDGPGEKWYEVDIAGGARVGLGERWEVQFGYVNRSAPSDFFTDVHQMELGFLYNDADPNYDFQLWPHLLVSVEFDEGSDASNDFESKTDEGVYLELGIRPEFELFHLGHDQPVRLAVPATLGLSVSDYYEDTDGDDETFGYFDVGLEFSGHAFKALAEANRNYAFRWQAGVHFLLLGDTTEDLSAFNGTGGDSFEIIGSIGITVDH